MDDNFDAKRFIHAASNGLEGLELKARSHHICDALTLCLPDNYLRALKILVASLHPHKQEPLPELTMSERGIRGWAVMPMGEYVARHGLEYFDESLLALKAFTSRFTQGI